MSKYWDEITRINEKQRKKGLNEYGQTLEDNKELTTVETLEMLEEEMVDALNYIEKLKELLKSDKTETSDLLKLLSQYLRY